MIDSRASPPRIRAPSRNEKRGLDLRGDGRLGECVLVVSDDLPLGRERSVDGLDIFCNGLMVI